MSKNIKRRSLRFPPLPDKRRARDELNLAEFPLGVLTDKEDPNRHTVTFEDQVMDSRFPEPIVRRVIVTSSPTFGGLPTAFDQDILLGLVNLTKANNNFTEPDVHFTRHQLIDLLELPNKGQTYDRIARSFHKWASVSVHYEYSWWKRGEGDWADQGFSFIDNFRLYDIQALARIRRGARTKQFEFPFSYFKWNQVIFQSFKDEYMRALDLEFYLSLELPITKRMFRFLAKRFHHSKTLRFDLKTFAFDKIGLSRSYEPNAGKIKEKLRPAFLELERKGFLKPIPETQRFVKLRPGTWKVSIIQSPTQLQEPDKATLSDDQKRIRRQLVERGIHEQRADELVVQFSGERIEEHIKHLEWLIGSGRKPKSPHGYLIRSIRENYEPPDGFIAKDQHPTSSSVGTKPVKPAAVARASHAEDIRRAEAFWGSLTLAEKKEHEEAALNAARRLLSDEPEGRMREEFLRNHALAQLESRRAVQSQQVPDKAPRNRAAG
jgi:hypothetical protein